MSYTFQGTIANDYRPEIGVNITIKDLEEDRIILQATKSHEFEKKQDSNTLTFTISPSSGGTEDAHSIKAKVKNGTKKLTTYPSNWKVQIKSSIDSTPADVNITFNQKQG